MEAQKIAQILDMTEEKFWLMKSEPVVIAMDLKIR